MLCAYALSGGASQAATLGSATPQDVSAGLLSDGHFSLQSLKITAPSPFDVRWGIHFVTPGRLTLLITMFDPLPTTAGLYASNAAFELGSFLQDIPAVGLTTMVLDWTYLTSNYYIFRVQGVIESPVDETSLSGQGVFESPQEEPPIGGLSLLSVEDPPVAEVVLPGTLGLLALGLSLVGIGLAAGKTRSATLDHAGGNCAGEVRSGP
jgi:hypothetical protein